MIDPGPVVDVALELLQAVHGATDLAAPAGNPAVYGVLEVGAGPGHDGGDQAEPERHLVLRPRVRTVVRDPDRSAATRMALDLAHRFEVAMLNRATPIAGDGWVVRRQTLLSTSGALAQGDVVNVVDDYEWWVVPT